MNRRTTVAPSRPLRLGCAVLLLGLAACAGRSVRPPEPELTDRPLPGTSRVLPSVQNESEARPGAPEAFPAPGTPRTGSAPPEAVGGQQTPARPAAPRPPGTSTPAPESHGFSVQLWVSNSKEVAESRRDALERALGVPVRVEPKDGLYRVRAGDFRTAEEADALRRRAILAGCADAMIVPPR